MEFMDEKDAEIQRLRAYVARTQPPGGYLPMVLVPTSDALDAATSSGSITTAS
jgi:hypothetical protein